MTYLLAGGRRVRAHPAADVFPLLSKDEITALAADIRTNGQRLPVLLQQADDGAVLVLDGRNRLLACEEAGLEPRVAYVEPTADAVQVIVSTNLVRRHQGESQRAMSAARLVVTLRGRPEKIASIDAISQGSAAGLLHLGRATVQRAVAIVDDPLLAPAVDAGTVAVSDAYAIRHAAEEAKRRALAAVADGSARTLRGALERESAGSATVRLGSTAPAADRATGRSEPSRGVGDRKDRHGIRGAGIVGRRFRFGNRAGGGRDVDRRSHRFGSTSSACCVRAARYRGGGSGRGMDAVRLGVIERQRVERQHADSSTGTGVGRRRCVARPGAVVAGGGCRPGSCGCARARSRCRKRRAKHLRRRCRASAFDCRVDRFVCVGRFRGDGCGRWAAAVLGVIERRRTERHADSNTGSGAGPAAGRAGRRSRWRRCLARLGPVVTGAGGGWQAGSYGCVRARRPCCNGRANRFRRRCRAPELLVGIAIFGGTSWGSEPGRHTIALRGCVPSVQDLVVAMERCLEAGLDEQALVAGLPADLFRSLEARLRTEIGHGSTSTQDAGDADGRGRGSAPLEQASNPRGWLERFGLNRSRQP